jgi:hypothetical protein
MDDGPFFIAAMIGAKETHRLEKKAAEKGHKASCNHVCHSNPINRIVFPGLGGHCWHCNPCYLTNISKLRLFLQVGDKLK